MSLKSSKKLNLDPRTAANIEEQISHLSDLYDVGWHLDNENPDIGTTLAKIYAGQVAENIGRVNDILDRYHTEFVNMLDISLLPAKPSSAIVVMDLLTDTVAGTPVARGTKLLTDGDEPYVFETDHSLYVTGSRIVSSFMADAETGAIVPLIGDFDKPEIIPKDYLRDENGEIPEESEPVEAPTEFVLDATDEDTPEPQNVFDPFTLFGEEEGIEQNVLMFYHPTVFDVTDDDIFVRISGNKDLVKDITSGRMHFGYLSENGLRPVEHMELTDDGETFLLRKAETNRTVTLGNRTYHVLTLQADLPVQDNRKVDHIRFSSKGRPQPPEAVNNETNDFEPAMFLPFSDTLSLFSECFIGHNSYFGKAGAVVTMTFTLNFEEHLITLTAAEEKENLKIIKRRPRAMQQEQIANCFAEDVAIEYYNGTGWKRLPLFSDQRNVFGSDQAQTVTMQFICPDDWVSSQSGSYDGRVLRLQLIKSDNCYLRPALHHYPIIRDLMISYSYEDTYVDAVRAEAILGTKRYDLTGQLKNEKGYMTFRKSDYDEDALYLGLNRRIENGPVSILFQLQDGVRFSGLKCRFEYRSYEGWRVMKILDYTQDFTRSGVVMFMPPHDMQRVTLEGQGCYWIRIVRGKKVVENENLTVLPRIENICLNAVQVSNVETRPEEQLYIEEVVPNMRFSLGAVNVYDVDVWVNEIGKYSRDTMLRMADEEPDRIKAEFDITGQITAFYIRWTEVDRLETSEDPRVYVLDRLRNELIFGDGLHTWIPRVTDDVALKFSVRCCDGALGNVPANSITEPMGYLMYVGSINNPVKAYGGSNIESLENALERGASILSSRNRLVSMDDYTRAIMAYSDTIDQVAGITGLTEENRADDSAVTFILLMKDFAEGSYAFHRIVGGLKQYLLDRCELTVTAERLHLIEPIYVDISVSVWVNVVQMDDSFEIQNLLQETLTEYLNPKGYGTGRGWKIGTIPKRSQLMMKLNVLKSRAVVRKAVMIANYSDHEGPHEFDLDDLKVTPFMICRSGRHQVHISI